MADDLPGRRPTGARCNSLLAGLAIYKAGEKLAAASQNGMAMRIALVLAVVVCGYTYFRALPGQLRFSDVGCYLYGRSLLRDLEPDALLVTGMPDDAEGITRGVSNDNEIFSVWYQQMVARRRPDVRVLASNFMTTPWYSESEIGRELGVRKWFDRCVADGKLAPIREGSWAFRPTGITPDMPSQEIIKASKNLSVVSVAETYLTSGKYGPTYITTLPAVLRPMVNVIEIREAPVIPGWWMPISSLSVKEWMETHPSKPLPSWFPPPMDLFLPTGQRLRVEPVGQRGGTP